MALTSMERPIPGVAWTWRQLGGLLGIIGVVLFVVGGLVQGDVPTTKDSISEVKAWFVDNGEQYIIGDYLIGLGVVFGVLPSLSCCGPSWVRSKASGPTGARSPS